MNWKLYTSTRTSLNHILVVRSPFASIQSPPGLCAPRIHWQNAKRTFPWPDTRIWLGPGLILSKHINFWYHANVRHINESPNPVDVVSATQTKGLLQNSPHNIQWIMTCSASKCNIICPIIMLVSKNLDSHFPQHSLTDDSIHSILNSLYKVPLFLTLFSEANSLYR